VLVHVHPGAEMIAEAMQLLAARAPFCIAFRPSDGTAALVPGSGPRERSEWRDGVFYRHYHPLTQLVLIGEGHELVSMAQISRAAGLPVQSFMTAEAHGDLVRRTGSGVTPVSGSALPDLPVDPFTAVVFLLHDRFKETQLLERTLEYEPFYVGALGSRRTHATRVARLEATGMSEERIARLRGPIGLYGPTRTSSALAISVLGEITEARMRLDG
jgi:xanthine dehydrogenase accessory factor